MNDNECGIVRHAFHLLYVPLHRIVAVFICHDVLHPSFERGPSFIPPLYISSYLTSPAVKTFSSVFLEMYFPQHSSIYIRHQMTSDHQMKPRMIVYHSLWSCPELQTEWVNSTSLLDSIKHFKVRVLHLDASKGCQVSKCPWVHPSLSPASCWTWVAQESLPPIYSSSITSSAWLTVPSVHAPLFLLCPFSLHFPVSLPDSWRRPCCISHTESNAITVSARGATFPRPGWGSGT